MASSFIYYKEQILKYLYSNDKSKVNTFLVKLEKKSQVKREYIVLGFLGFLAIYLIFGYGAQLICNSIGFVYPAFCSIKALESTNKDDDTRWLTYWVVFAVFSVFEFFSDILLSWFPLYWLAKCLFLAWCFMPLPWNGSDVIYHRIVRPFFMKHQEGIDSTLNKVTDRIGDIAEHAQRAMKND